MLKKYKDSKELNMTEVNKTVSLLHKILKISYILIIVIGVYAATLILKEWEVLSFVKTFINILAPFFIGLVIAWLFNPIVTWLQKKKIRRIFGSAIVYIVFLFLIFIIVYSLIPILTNQVNDLVSSIPSFIDDASKWINNVFDNLSANANINLDGFKNNIFTSLTEFGRNMTDSLPTKVVSIITSLISGVGTFGLGLIIGFYMLLNFDNVSKTLISFLPKKIRNDASILFSRVNEALLHFVRGTFTVSFVIFITNYIGFLLIGIKAPLFFALFCGITNIIPYAGPYIGGIPVSIVALSQDTTMGILTIIYIACIQMLEGNFLQPVVMAKTMKLHPVTILLGLLIFGYLFGIVGMIIATPLIAVLKTIFIFFDEKFDLMRYQDE